MRVLSISATFFICAKKKHKNNIFLHFNILILTINIAEINGSFFSKYITEMEKCSKNKCRHTYTISKKGWQLCNSLLPKLTLRIRIVTVSFEQR